MHFVGFEEKEYLAVSFKIILGRRRHSRGCHYVQICAHR